MQNNLNNTKSMQTKQIYYCKVGNCVHDAHMQKWAVKEHNRWRYADVNGQKVG